MRNIMRDDQGDLVAIDPRGLAGDPAFDLLPLLRGEWPTDLDRAIAEFADAAEVPPLLVLLDKAGPVPSWLGSGMTVPLFFFTISRD